MRTLVITQNLTVDGYVEMLDDWFDLQLQDDELLAEAHRQDEQADALLLGRRTFEDLRSYWPHKTDDATGITDYLNDVDKYVVSSTITDPGWVNSTVLNGDWLESVRELKQRDGLDIVVTGSITLCQALIDARLVDEYRFSIYPLAQARGRTLFGRPGMKLRPVGTPMSFRSGIVLLRYQPA